MERRQTRLGSPRHWERDASPLWARRRAHEHEIGGGSRDRQGLRAGASEAASRRRTRAVSAPSIHSPREIVQRLRRCS
eukprot:scaffold7630_cov122-Isochrysis_galbana.AAC.3